MVYAQGKDATTYNLHLSCFCWYNNVMKKLGRPKKQNPLDEYIELRVTESEKKAFRDAADRSGIPMATWIRERLRRIATRELQNAELPVAFLE